MNPLSFTKDWTRPTDFPTVENSEQQVREDMQLLHNETKDYINANLVPAAEQTLSLPLAAGTGTNALIENAVSGTGANTASGTRSHAEGGFARATGTCAHAEGGFTAASGDYSHAQGNSTTASGMSAHAEGAHAQASGTNAHAEGENTIANHRSQHVFGEFNQADPSSATATARGMYVEIVGNGNMVDGRSNARTLDWNGNETLSGKLTLGAGPTGNMDAVTKQYADAGDAAAKQYADAGLAGKQNTLTFDAAPTADSANPVTSGGVYTALQNVSGGVTSFKGRTGAVTPQSGDYTADQVGALPKRIQIRDGLGDGAVVMNNAEGDASGPPVVLNAASGSYATAAGYLTTANHRSQLVFGECNESDPSSAAASERGNYVEIVGNGDELDGPSNARTLDWNGNETLAGKLTLGVGPSNNMDAATKQYVDGALAGKLDNDVPIRKGSVSSAVIEGYVSGSNVNTASALAAHAEGIMTSASGIAAHAEGRATVASKNAAHAEGYNTASDGLAAHAEGYNTQAKETAAHSEGMGSIAYGSYAHAEGLGTIATNKSQHVFGEYNQPDESSAASTARGTYVEIVGNGSGNNYADRSNARTLDWSGNETLAGKLTLGAGPTANMDAATKQYVDSGLAGKQNTLTFDATPTANSANPVTSGGVYTALQNAGGGYAPPSGGIPKTDLAADVQTSLGKADTAVQPSAYSPSAKTSGQTQPVGVDSSGKLWTLPGGSGSGGISVSGAAAGDLVRIAAVDANGVPTSWGPISQVDLDMLEGARGGNLWDDAYAETTAEGYEDGVAWNTAGTDANAYVCGYIPVKPGKTYYISNQKSNSNAPFFSGDNQIRAYDAAKQLVGGWRYYYYNAVNSITLPASAVYLRFNLDKRYTAADLYLSTEPFSADNLGPGVEVTGLYGNYARMRGTLDAASALADGSLTLDKLAGSVTNLFDVSQNTEENAFTTYERAFHHGTNRYWGAAGSYAGRHFSYLIPVTPGESYYLQNITLTGSNEASAIYYTAAKELTTEAYKLTASGNAITVPSGVSYMRVPTSHDTMGTVMVLKGRSEPADYYVPYGSAVDGLVAVPGPDSISCAQLAEDAKPHRFTGARVGCLGDSLTALGSRWQTRLARKLGFASVTNYGVSGTTVTSARGEGTSTYRDRAPAMSDDLDLILVMTSINDNGAPYGVFNESQGTGTLPDAADKTVNDVSTVRGAGLALIGILRNKYPHADIVFFSHPHTHWSWSFGEADAYAEVCGRHSVPFFDLLRRGGIDGTVSAENTWYFTDGIHLTDAGNDRVADYMAACLRTL